MGSFVKKSVLSIGIVLFVSSCGNAPKPSTSCRNGAYCYKNINFGKSRGSSFEKGIRDGCKTGEGVFTKDYSRSRSDNNYFDGWILGRSKCRQILPNEGTILEEKKSRQRAEYQIRQLRMEQESQPQEENLLDAIIDNSNKNFQVQETEY